MRRPVLKLWNFQLRTTAKVRDAPHRLLVAVDARRVVRRARRVNSPVGAGVGAVAERRHGDNGLRFCWPCGIFNGPGAGGGKNRRPQIIIVSLTASKRFLLEIMDYQVGGKNRRRYSRQSRADEACAIHA